MELETSEAPTHARPIKPPEPPPPASTTEFVRGATVGRYVLLDRLGAGAMGVVHAAYDPELDRKIALKLVLPARSGDGTYRTRLLREAQALAKLSHPNVVAVHDVGTHGEQVWIAMEFVAGKTLGAWAKDRPPRWPERLRVLADVARGVAAAHAAGLVHRDLKPDNVMIDDDARVRVMDFGLAHGRGTTTITTTDTADPDVHPEHAALAEQLTQVGISPGTPAYMAPEQWRGQEAGTAADIFSWSILAWELLYGERPFRGGSRYELATAVTTGKRRPPPRGRRVPKWLRRVLERGLAPDPADRWPSMAALLTALERGRTRARLQLVAVVALILTTLTGLALGLHSWDLARRAAACTAAGAEIDATWNDEARREVRAAFTASGAPDAAATVDRVTPWLDERAAAWQRARTDACVHEDRSTRDAALTVPALWCLEDRQMELAALVAEFKRATPTTVQKAVTAATSLGTTDLCADEGVLRRLPVPPDSEREALRSLRADLTHARSLDLTGQYKPALELASETRAAATAWAPLAAAAQAQESISRVRLGQYAEAEADGMGAYFTAANVGAWTVAAATATTLITVVGVQQARTGEAQVWARHAEMAISQAGDPTGLLTAKRLSYLGLVQLGAGALAEAHDLLARGLVLWEAALGPDHPDVAKSVGNLGIVASARGQHAEARALYARTLEIYERTLGPDHPDVAQVLGNVGHDHNDTGEYAAAIPLFERSLAIFERTLDPGHPNIATNLCNLATAHLMLGDPAKARPRLERCLQIYERALGPDHPQLVEALDGLTVVHTAAGELAEARTLAARALEILERAHGPEHTSVALALDHLAEVALASGADADARALASRALAIVDRTPDRARTTELRTLRILADLALRSGQPAAALPLAERAVQTAGAVEGVQPDRFVVDFLLARSLVAVGGDAARALGLATAARDGLRAAGPLHATRLAEVERWLAERPR